MKSRHCGVGAHQYQRKKEEGGTCEKSEEKERGRGTEGETLYPSPGNWCPKRGKRTEWKTEKEHKERNRERVTNPATPDHLMNTIKTINVSESKSHELPRIGAIKPNKQSTPHINIKLVKLVQR